MFSPYSSQLECIEVEPTHYFPLHFAEAYEGGSDTSPTTEQMFNWAAAEEVKLYEQLDKTNYWQKVGQHVKKLIIMALEAHALPKPEAIAQAQQALAINPLCSEAYVVLGRFSDSFEEALVHFKKAADIGLKSIVPQDMVDIVEEERGGKDADIWRIFPLRSYCRGLYGAGSCLKKMKRYKEALEYFEKLYEHQKTVPSGTDFPNFHLYLPELWLRVWGPKGCMQRCKAHPSRDELGIFLDTHGNGLNTGHSYSCKAPLMTLTARQVNRSTAQPLVLALLEAGATIINLNGLSAMHEACYYGAAPEVVKTLMTMAGGDPLEKGPGYQPGVSSYATRSPLTLAAEQGSWEALDMMLTLRPDILEKQWDVVDKYYPRRRLFPTVYVLMMWMLDSSCVTCLGGGKKCHRCLDDCPHGEGVDFRKTAEVLVKYGLRYEDYKLNLDDFRKGTPCAELVMVIRLVSRKATSNARSTTTQASSTSASVAPLPPTAVKKPPTLRACKQCGRRSEKLQKCNGCGYEYYCNAVCQRKHWREHKEECKELQQVNKRDV